MAALPQAMSKPDADDRDLLAVGGDAADRHHVAEMTVGHQCGTLRAARHIGELCQRLRFVIAEDCGLAQLVFCRESEFP